MTLSRKEEEFLAKMVVVRFLHPSEALTPEVASNFPSTVPLPMSDIHDKTVVLFYEESTLQANEDQTTMWGKKGEHMLRSKRNGSGIMVSDFADEKMVIWLLQMRSLLQLLPLTEHYGKRLVASWNMASQERATGPVKNSCCI